MYLFIPGVLFTLTMYFGEQYAEKNPEKPFTKWWRNNMISDTHDED